MTTPFVNTPGGYDRFGGHRVAIGSTVRFDQDPVCQVWGRGVANGPRKVSTASRGTSRAHPGADNRMTARDFMHAIVLRSGA